MDLTVGLTLRARAEGTSAIRAMREEMSALSTASREAKTAFEARIAEHGDRQRSVAMQQVRDLARSGGQASLSTIKAFGGFAEFEEAFAKAQRELAGGLKGDSSIDQEKLFRARLRMTNEQARVRLTAANRTAAEERRADAQAQAAIRREAEATTAFKMRMWRQQATEAEREAAEEAKAAAVRRQSMRDMGLGLFAGARPGVAGHGGRHGRGIMQELRTAAGYTLVYGGINRLLQGVGAVASSPFTIGKMTLGVADQAREIIELGNATRLTTDQVQELQYAFRAKGLNEEKLPQMMQFLARSEVGAARGIKNNAIAFKALGISVADAHHRLKPLDDLLLEVSDRIHELGGGSKSMAISQMIFGRRAREYMPFLDGGSASIRSLAGQADKDYVIRNNELKNFVGVDEQSRQVELQLSALKRRIAVAALRLVSSALTGASECLTSHQAEISRTISSDFGSIKGDMPAIINGMGSMVTLGLQLSKVIGPVASGVSGTINAISEDVDNYQHRRLWWQKDIDKATGAWNHLAGRTAADDQRDASRRLGALVDPPHQHQMKIVVEAARGTNVKSVTSSHGVSVDVRRGARTTG